VSTSSIEQELHKRGSAALAYLSHHAVVDMYAVFSCDAELTRTVQAVNIAVQASNIVQRANVDIYWQATHLRDWVLILEYGSRSAATRLDDAVDATARATTDQPPAAAEAEPDTSKQDTSKQDTIKQSYWAALLATSVLATFTARCRPRHVDILQALSNTEVLALEFLHTRSLGRTYIDYRNVSALSTMSGVSPKALCNHVLMPAEACKHMLRHLYTLNLIKGVSDGAGMSMRQLYLTEVGFALMSRLRFGVTKLA
jgi:hypothetical protein